MPNSRSADRAWEPTIAWVGALPGRVRLIDQTSLPDRFRRIDCADVPSLVAAIRSLRVRGAPALGAAGALGVVLACQRTRAPNWAAFARDLARAARAVGEARPTAVNLRWGVERICARARALRGRPVSAILRGMLAEARAALDEDRAVCRRMAAFGAALLPRRGAILTHCNTGALAAVDYGTALAVVFKAVEQGKRIHVWADETRPLLQGARLTTWECLRARIPVTLICDNMAAQVLREGRIDCVLVGADRIAANGDAANKIGTYGLAVLARAHRVPFYVVAPVSTVDFDCPSGDRIPIEQRPPDEVREARGVRFAPRRVPVYNPAFDVTPARLIAGIVTERGVLRPPYRRALARLAPRRSDGALRPVARVRSRNRSGSSPAFGRSAPA